MARDTTPKTWPQKKAYVIGIYYSLSALVLLVINLGRWSSGALPLQLAGVGGYITVWYIRISMSLDWCLHIFQFDAQIFLHCYVCLASAAPKVRLEHLWDACVSCPACQSFRGETVWSWLTDGLPGILRTTSTSWYCQTLGWWIGGLATSWMEPLEPWKCQPLGKTLTFSSYWASKSCSF